MQCGENELLARQERCLNDRMGEPSLSGGGNSKVCKNYSQILFHPLTLLAGHSPIGDDGNDYLSDS